MKSPEPRLFPMFVRLAGRPCLVVGGGGIAESKVQSLLEAGANVTVVSPKLATNLWKEARLGSVVWVPRTFELGDLDGIFLVIAATSSDEVNELVYREAERRNILCNAVDQPSRCHFYFPAVVRRGALQIAISTGGLSPALAQRIRKELEVQYVAEYEEWIERLGRLRAHLMRRGFTFENRKRLLHRLASRQAFEKARARQLLRKTSKGAAE